MVDETLFDYLHMAIVDYYSKEDDKDSDSSMLYLSQIGKYMRRGVCVDPFDCISLQATVLVTR